MKLGVVDSPNLQDKNAGSVGNLKWPGTDRWDVTDDRRISFAWRTLARSAVLADAIQVAVASVQFEGGPMSLQPWQEIVKQIERESNPAKIAELAEELNDAMITEEKEKVKRRLGISVDRQDS